ncbi:helix-turn-helix domain-containing protein [Plectonema radiosum]|uniref:helix-turn-helix domain-containing protein n=1 Tax=Plectonema radiosum TaxID=945768 RepID=UPI001D13F1D3|nr:helix-turn-helix domain-containing protein [Plectonema radiosum]
MTSFTSATLGEINPPINILKEFLATFNRRQKCKAAILSWLDGKHYYGNSWIRITFENLADILGYCRETISKHMKELIFDGLVEDKPSHRFPKDTASEYRLNLQNISETIEFNRCEIIDTNPLNISGECANNPPTSKTYLKFSENNNTAAEEDKVDEPEEETQIPRYDEKLEESDSNQNTDSGADKFPPSQVKVITTSEKPVKPEIKEVCAELKRLRINPDPCLGVIKKYWDNVNSAIARVKEAIHEGWCDNPTGLFIATCKNGEKPKNTVTDDVSVWFEWARRERIVIAMSQGMVYTPDGEAVEIKEMMQRCPKKD